MIIPGKTRAQTTLVVLANLAALLAGCGSPNHTPPEGESTVAGEHIPEARAAGAIGTPPQPVRAVEIGGSVPAGPGSESATRVEPGTLRVVPVHQHELLQPETRALEGLRARLTRGDRRLVEGPVSEAERRFAAALAHHPYAEGETPSPSEALPENWQGVESVVLVVLYPPAGSGRASFPGGAGAVMLLRPPNAEPVFRMRTPPPTHRRWETRAPFEGSTYAGYIERMLEGLGPSEEDR